MANLGFYKVIFQKKNPPIYMQHRLSLKLPPNLSRIIKERKSDSGFYKPYKGHKDNIKSGLKTRVCLDISQVWTS